MSWVPKRCRKKKYKTLAKARKALRARACARTCKRAYLCAECSTPGNDVYHLTSQK